MVRRLWLGILLLLAVPCEALAQPASPAALLEQALAAHGFENVSAIIGDERVTVTYENRRYRDEVRALDEAARLALPHVPPGSRLTLVPQRRGLPLLAVSMNAGEEDGDAMYAAAERHATAETHGSGDHAPRSTTTRVPSFDVSTDVAANWNAIKHRPRRNGSFGRFDLVLHPQFSGFFGDRQDAFQTQMNVAPELTIALRKGLSLSAAVILPLQNDLERDGDFVRPGVMAINQTFRLPRSTFVSLTAGYFTRNRYGLDAEAAVYLAGGRWLLSARAGYTGYASFRKGTWTYGSPDVLTFSAGVERFLPRYTTSLHARFERYLLEDVGVRFGVDRAFGEITLGFFGLVTSDGDNVGVRFSVPLFVRKYGRPARLRVRPPRAFPWEYRYQGLPQTGLDYRVTNRADRLWDELPPRFLENQMRELYDGR